MGGLALENRLSSMWQHASGCAHEHAAHHATRLCTVRGYLSRVRGTGPEPLGGRKSHWSLGQSPVRLWLRLGGGEVRFDVNRARFHTNKCDLASFKVSETHALHSRWHTPRSPGDYIAGQVRHEHSARRARALARIASAPPHAPRDAHRHIRAACPDSTRAKRSS